jgi:hypothetical protein
METQNVSKAEQSAWGAVANTTLFNVMINDLSAQLGQIKNVKSTFFSDDLVM